MAVLGVLRVDADHDVVVGDLLVLVRLVVAAYLAVHTRYLHVVLYVRRRLALGLIVVAGWRLLGGAHGAVDAVLLVVLVAHDELLVLEGAYWRGC